MKILIDTQIILWILFEVDRFTEAEKKIITASENQIICSSISLFEISLKYSIGKLKLCNITPEKLPTLLIENGYLIEEVNYDIFSTFYKLPCDIHKDPFDRILIWQAIKNNFFLMSRDKEIKKYQKFGLNLI